MSIGDTVKLQVRLPRDLHEQLQALSEEEHRRAAALLEQPNANGSESRP